ncbi:MAG: ABC transporter permease [Deltaproteobacteria bacterium]|jgi:taurine transport system permease protein|nr:ABC transporter permease [Deltaproteobacteria bacterium]
MSCIKDFIARRGNAFFSVLSIFGVFILWSLCGSLNLIDPIILPPLGEVWGTALDMLFASDKQTALPIHIAVSLARSGTAFVLAILIGIPLGLAMGVFPRFGALMEPFTQFVRPLPKLALIPLVILWLGIGESSKVFLIFISAFFSIVVGAAAATQNVKTQRLRLAQALGATPYQQIRYFVLPSALPEIFTAVRISIGVGWTTLVAAEMVAASSGLGWLVMNASNYLRTDIVMLGILVLGGIGYLLDLIIVTLQRSFVPWTGKD